MHGAVALIVAIGVPTVVAFDVSRLVRLEKDKIQFLLFLDNKLTVPGFAFFHILDPGKLSI
jgi:hypothetical protein